MFITNISNTNGSYDYSVSLFPITQERRESIVNHAINGGYICGGQICALQTRRVTMSQGTALITVAATEVAGNGGTRKLGFVTLSSDESLKGRLTQMNISKP